jgi:hypothetical protein
MVREGLGDENFLHIVLDSVFAELKTIGCSSYNGGKALEACFFFVLISISNLITNY